jgi:hypothetical protein
MSLDGYSRSRHTRPVGHYVMVRGAIDFNLLLAKLVSAGARHCGEGKPYSVNNAIRTLRRTLSRCETRGFVHRTPKLQTVQSVPPRVSHLKGSVQVL